jgi:hypothetical protein
MNAKTVAQPPLVVVELAVTFLRGQPVVLNPWAEDVVRLIPHVVWKRGKGFVVLWGNLVVTRGAVVSVSINGIVEAAVMIM